MNGQTFRITNEEAGFTIIELLVVVTIIGTLAGIGLSAWALYKTRSFNTAALTDLRNSLTSLETYMDDNEEYPICENTDCETSMSGLARTPGVHIEFASTGGLSGTAIACYPSKGDIAYYRPSVVDVVVEVPIGTCGS